MMNEDGDKRDEDEDHCGGGEDGWLSNFI